MHVDPTQDGAEVVNMVSDRVRAELLRRIGLADVLTPRALAVPSEAGMQVRNIRVAGDDYCVPEITTCARLGVCPGPSRNLLRASPQFASG